MKTAPKAPEHLSPAAAEWWACVVREYAIEDHLLAVVTGAAESWDRVQQARAAIAEHGLVYLDRFEQPKARPEVAMERDWKILFCRQVRELGLSVGDVDDEADRPPRIASTSQRKVS